MTSSIVFLTGASGFIGFGILLDLLKAGYHVRAAVRTAEKSKAISECPAVQALNPGNRLTFVEIPDFAAPNAFDEGLAGATFIIHSAAPVPYPTLDPETGIYQPIVQAMTNLLEATLKAPTLKRVVMTSSIAATVPRISDPNVTYDPSSRAAAEPGPYEDVDAAYWAAKTRVLNEADAFVAQRALAFDLIHVMPGYTFGPHPLVSTAAGLFTSSLNLLLAILQGHHLPFARGGCASHIDDVAAVHRRVLEAPTPANRDYGISYPVRFNDAFQIVQKHFPREVEDGTLTYGDLPTEPIDWDVSATEETLGIKFKDYEAMVVDTVSQFLKLRAEQAS